MKLTNEGLKDRKAWEEAGYHLPKYDREAVTKNTKENPMWVHFGAGNIFRAFQANVMQDLLNQGVLDRGLVAMEGFDYKIIEEAYRPYDDFSILVTLKADGNIEKTVVGSVVESCILDSERDDEYSRAKEIFCADNIVIVTQEYHLYRALYLAKSFGLEAHGVSSDYYIYAGQTMRDIREILARNKDFFTAIFKPYPTYLGEAIPVNGDGNLTND